MSVWKPAFLIFLVLPYVQGQSQQPSLPTVAGAAVPLYPPLARVANVEGVVRLRIATDGQRVTSARVIEGNKMLAAAAEENIHTWTFSRHESTAFVVTYRYRLTGDSHSDNPTVLLRLPKDVEISIPRHPRIN